MSRTVFDEMMILTRTVSSPTALDDEEAKALFYACCGIPDGSSIVEIGCQLGRSSSLLLQVAKARNLQTTHIDPYIENPEYLPQWIKMMHGIGYPFMFICARSEQVADAFGDIGLLFIDGDHEYLAVRRDLNLFAGSVRSGGFLAMHDYRRDSLPDVTRAANEYLEDDIWDQISVAGTLGVWRKR